jgi:hypothetical protein
MANVEGTTVSVFTLCYRGVPDTGEIKALDAVAAARGARLEWGVHPRFGRAYALLADADGECIAGIRGECRAIVVEAPVIALAVFPSVEEALPSIIDALCGEGRPVGMVACDLIRGGCILEWDLERTSAELILELIDAELDRFRAHRMSELLSPMPLTWWTRIAAEGLRCPQIRPDRVIEELLERHHVRG